MTIARTASGAPLSTQAAIAGVRAGNSQNARIPGAFQLLLGFYILLTGELPMIVQALAFGLRGGAEAEFGLAVVLSLVHDLLMLAPVLVFASHPLGILHPLILAVVVWPLLVGMPAVIEQFGGWTGVVVGLPLETPFYSGLHIQDSSMVWLAVAKYEALQIVALIGTYFGFWLYKGKLNSPRIPSVITNLAALRRVLFILFGISLLALATFLYFRGGVGEHLTSLGRGRFRELSGMGPVIVLIDLAAIALYLWIAARPGDTRSPLFLGCLALAVAAQFVSTGSRSSAIIVLLTVGLIWTLRTRRIPWRLGLVLLPILFVAIGFLGAIRSSSWSNSTAAEVAVTTSWSDSLAEAQSEIAERRSASASVPVIARGFEVSGGAMLGQTYLAAITGLIPRAIWEDKPRGPGSIYAQEFLGVGREGTAIPVSAEAEMYWNFGIPGIVILSALFGFLLGVVFHSFWRRYPDPFAVVIYVLFVTSFQFATDRLVGFQQQLLLLLICYTAVVFFIPRSPPLHQAVVRRAAPIRTAPRAT